MSANNEGVVDLVDDCNTTTSSSTDIDDIDDDDDYNCDESRCVSSSLSDLFNNSFNCYADGDRFPSMCSDGYKPRIVQTEPFLYNNNTEDDDDDYTKLLKPFKYYSCCPPNLAPEIKVSRHCSNPTTDFNSIDNVIAKEVNDEITFMNNSNSDPNINIITSTDCGNSNNNTNTNRSYPRQMKPRQAFGITVNGFGDFEVESFIFCDSININNIIMTNNSNGTRNNNENEDAAVADDNNFLDIIDCVPYVDKTYEAAIVYNSYGVIITQTCGDPEVNFVIPKLVERNTTNNSMQYEYQMYECCKTIGSSPPAPPFEQDKMFKITVYPQIALSSVAVISTLILVLALIIPLWLHPKNKLAGVLPIVRNITRTSRSIVRGEEEGIGRASTGSGGGGGRASTVAGRGGRGGRASAGGSGPVYSGYNLYLVYLALPDPVLNLYILGMYSSYVNQKHHIDFEGIIVLDFEEASFEGSFVVACSTANLCINCVVLYEIRILLQRTKDTIRYKPPSLTKVTIQAAVVYIFSIIVFTIHYVIKEKQTYFYTNDNTAMFKRLEIVNLTLTVSISYMFPILFSAYICITIWFHKLLPVGGKMRELALYFFRVIAVIYGIWTPGMILIIIGGTESSALSGRYITIGFMFIALQPILSTFISLTKSDVRKHVIDLTTLTYIRHSYTKSTIASYEENDDDGDVNEVSD